MNANRGVNGMLASGGLSTFVEYRLRKTARKLVARMNAALRDRADALTHRTGGPHAAAFTRSRYGVLMRANWRDRTFLYCHHAIYGRALADLLDRADTPFCFLDVGANQGLYSLIAARNPACVGAIALEPVPATFAILNENAAANDLATRITGVDAALSDRPGTATISIDSHHSGTASLEHRATREAAATLTVRVIDHQALDMLIPHAVPLIVKVDVEGHEPVVIAELLKSRHAGAIRHLFYEVDTRWTDPAGLEGLLRAHGFTAFRRFGVGRHYDMLASRDDAAAAGSAMRSAA